MLGGFVLVAFFDLGDHRRIFLNHLNISAIKHPIISHVALLACFNQYGKASQRVSQVRKPAVWICVFSLKPFIHVTTASIIINACANTYSPKIRAAVFACAIEQRKRSEQGCRLRPQMKWDLVASYKILGLFFSLCALLLHFRIMPAS